MASMAYLRPLRLYFYKSIRKKCYNVTKARKALAHKGFLA